MVSSMKGVPTSWDIKTKKNVKWVAAARLAELRQSGGGRRPGLRRHQQRAGAQSQGRRRPRRADVLPRIRRQVPVAAHQREAGRRAAPTTGRIQGVCSSPLVEGDRLYYVTNRCEVVCLDTKGDGNGGAKVLWKFDMMEEVGSRAAQHVELLAGLLRRPDLRQHRQRPGRKPRPRSLAARAVDHRASTRRPASWCGKTTRAASRFCTASGPRRRSARSATWCRWFIRRATAGCAATKR